MPIITKQSKYQKIITSVGMIAFLATAILATEQLVQAEKSPFDSGYDHGCSDARKSPDDRYINEDGKGPDNHTDEFMDGYNDGYNSCSGSGNVEQQQQPDQLQAQGQSSNNENNNENNNALSQNQETTINICNENGCIEQ